tara:strand:- start:302 stop:448 length:147 start_codon:yes stop_codon:yes gene_type:complete
MIISAAVSILEHEKEKKIIRLKSRILLIIYWEKSKFVFLKNIIFTFVD